MLFSKAEITAALTTLFDGYFSVDTLTPCIGDAGDLAFDPTKFYYGSVRVSPKSISEVCTATFYSGAAGPGNVALNIRLLPQATGHYQNVLFTQCVAKNANVLFEGYVIDGELTGIDDGEGGSIQL